MRVAIVANAAATHTQRWANAMSQRGHNVRVYSVRQEPIGSVTVISMLGTQDADPSRAAVAAGYVKLRYRLAGELERFNPDVVHAHYASTNGYIAALARVRPTVLTVWGTDVVPKPGRSISPTQRHRIHKAVRHADVVTSASEFMADHVRDIAQPGRIEIIPFGVDLEIFRPTPPATAPMVLIAKSLESRYGIEHVIAAMDRVVRAVPDAKLTIAGGGSLRSPLEDLAARSDAPITFLGKVPHTDLAAEITKAAVVVNPTIVDESFGVIILEAQAMGRPVVSTKVGAVSDVCVEGETATLVAPGDPDAMAEAIIDVLSGDELENAGSLGPGFVREHFDWRTSVAEMEGLYEEIGARH